MLEESIRALAAACGDAVVRSVKTDKWLSVRDAVARILSCGDRQHELTLLDLLDRTARQLEAAENAKDAPVDRMVAEWQNRIADLLQQLVGDQQAAAIQELGERVILPASDTNTRVVGHRPTSVYFAGNHVVGHTSPGPVNDPDDDWEQGS
ncbi:hypothetical protein [Streptomyces sp. NPDC059389]|uniref:hypothetical protein n=1 Tax=Streptomyces sp. NPDC059389 TaxID=3346818 RepID=UPI0036863316